MAEQLLVGTENRVRVECRVHERHACDLVSACHPASAFADKEVRWPATLADISLGGVRLLLRRRFEPGSGLAVELPAGDDREPYTVFAKVVWARRQGDRSWALGCKFVSELSEEELRRLLPAARQEQKIAQANRTTTYAPATVLDDANTRILRDVRFRLTAWHGTVRYCLIRRLKVPETWPFPPGRIVVLRGVCANGWRCVLRGEVIACRRQSERWTLECVTPRE